MAEVTDAEILAAILSGGGNYVSGAKIAEDTGVSRVAIRGRLEKLRAEGFAFDAVRNKGYRLETFPPGMHPALLAAHLLNSASPANLHFFKETDSTNTQAARLLAEGEETPFVVVAGRQTAGRGRRGRAWHSEDAGNLYLSIALRPLLPPARMQTFTLWMGLATCLAVKDLCNVSLQVKWPNDLHWQGRKVAGMLTEARSDSELLHDLVFGLGLNINGDTGQFPAEVRAVAASLCEASGAAYAINAIAADLIHRLLEACEAFLSGDYRTVFAENWEVCDALTGREITVSTHDGELSGRYQGIGEDGTLRLRTADGALNNIAAGDATIQK